VNLVEKLVSALEEIDKLKGNNKKKKDQLHKYEKKDNYLNEIEKIVIILKTQIDEAKIVEELVRSQLKEK
jgi:hypothetical protein